MMAWLAGVMVTVGLLSGAGGVVTLGVGVRDRTLPAVLLGGVTVLLAGVGVVLLACGRVVWSCACLLAGVCLLALGLACLAQGRSSQDW